MSYLYSFNHAHSFRATAVLVGLTMLILGNTVSAEQLRAVKDSANSATYKPTDFLKIQAEGSADITIRQGSENEIVIEASPQVRERVEVHQDGSVIKIRLGGGWKFWDSQHIKVSVTFKTLEEISIAGSGNLVGKGRIKVPKLYLRMAGAGDFTFDDVHTEEMRISLSGAGDARMTGETKQLSLSIAGAGDFDGERYKSGKARISIAGAGDAKVWATEELSVSIAGAGSVSHWGKAKILKQSIAGVGSISDKGER